MLRRIKQSVAVLLVTVLLSTMFMITPYAAETDNTGNADLAISANDYSVEGNSSVGNLIADEIADHQSQQSESDGSYVISGIEVSDNIATVSYSAENDCTILVAIYDENTGAMLASGKAQALAEDDAVEVSIEAEAMPQYFIAKAFMLDESNAPLGDCFVEERYTQGVQEVIELDASEFDEEKVLNLDDDTSTNFAIYNDDVIAMSASEYNIPSSIDEESGIYVFTNCNDELTSLVSGDIISYEYEVGNVLIIKVKEISIDGTTVTIIEDDTIDIDEVFDYVKIETSQTIDDAAVDMSHASEGVILEEAQSEVQNNSKCIESVGVHLDAEGEFGKKFNIFSFGDEDENGVSGKLDLFIGINPEIDLYINNKFWKYKTHYLDFKIGYSAEFEFEITAKYKKKISKTIAEFDFSPVAGVYIGLEPKIVFTATAEISANVGFEGSVGFNASFKNGVQNTSKSPEFNCECEFEGELIIGFDLSPRITILKSWIANASLDLTVGAGLTVEPTEDSDGEEHLCKLCFSGEVGPMASLEAEVKLAKKLVGELEVDFFFSSKDFYFSVDHLKFGWGDCPYVKPKSTEPKPTEPKPTEPKPTEPKPTEPKPTEPIPTEPIPTEPAPTEPIPTEPIIKTIASGACGANITWEFLSDGTLNIEGTGSINNYAYYSSPWYEYNDKITQVNISNGITGIGDRAFAYCCSLNNITILNSVISIGDCAFYECQSLESINIPDGITEIGDCAFYKCINLTSVTFSDGVKIISVGAFEGCSNLTSITIPDSLTSIGSSAFIYCYSLENVTIPDSVKIISDDAFSYCTSLKNITIPDSVTSIGNRAFDCCYSLENIVISDSVTSIVDRVFSSCSNLKSITIPDSVTSIGNGVFESCYSLENVTIPDSVTTIGAHAFSNCSSLKSITIPDSVTSIGGHAFQYCSSLKSIKIPDSVKSIDESAFEGCSSLTNITIPDSVTSIGGHAFQYCSSLKSITIPDSVTSIGGHAFQYCSSLKSITIPDSVKSIGESAFGGCSSLKSITIPDSVKSIDESAFGGCSSLTNITIPDSVIYIGTNAFKSCDSLENIYFEGDAPSFGSSTFCSVTATAYYPANNSTWTSKKLKNYSGTITWVAYDPCEAVSASYKAKATATVSSQNTDETKSITTINAEYDNKVSNADYIIAVVKDPNAEDVLSADNLLYIDQITADENGNISKSIPIPSGIDSYDIVVYGPEKQVQKGDVDGDGTLSIMDATEIQKYIIESVAFDEKQKEIADVNGDGTIDILDATEIQKFLADLPSAIK